MSNREGNKHQAIYGIKAVGSPEGIQSYSGTSPSEKHPGHNEDRVVREPAEGLYGVCDGMGGMRGGAQAATIAADGLKKLLGAPTITHDGTVLGLRKLMSETLGDISKEIHTEFKGQGGTTINVAKIIEHPNGTSEKLAVIANLGDSPAFHFDLEGNMTQVTIDDNGAFTKAVNDILIRPEALGWMRSGMENGTTLLESNEQRFKEVALKFPMFDPDSFRVLMSEKAEEIKKNSQFSRLLDQIKSTKDQEFFIRLAIEAEIVARERQAELGNVKNGEDYARLSSGLQHSFKSRNIIHKAAGIFGKDTASVYVVKLKPGEGLLQVSDGISDVLTHKEIARIVKEARALGRDPLSELINEATERNKLDKGDDKLEVDQGNELRAKPDDKSGVYLGLPKEALVPIVEVVPPGLELVAPGKSFEHKGEVWNFGDSYEIDGKIKLSNKTTSETVEMSSLQILKRFFPGEASKYYKLEGVVPREFSKGDQVNIIRSSGVKETWYSTGKYDKTGRLLVNNADGTLEKGLHPFELQGLNEIKNPDLDFNKANSLNDIIRIVGNMGGIPGSGLFYTKEDILLKLNGSAQEMGKIAYIPSTSGLRYAVKRVLERAKARLEEIKAEKLREEIRGISG